jgi:hypothetical protein
LDFHFLGDLLEAVKFGPVWLAICFTAVDALRRHPIACVKGGTTQLKPCFGNKVPVMTSKPAPATATSRHTTFYVLGDALDAKLCDER